MKHSVAFVLMFLLSVPVTVWSSEPISPHAAVIAEVSTYGGLTPVPTPAYGVRILSNGQVEQFRGRPSVSLAVLSQDRARALQATIEAVGEGVLQDLQEGEPMCADAPVTDFNIHQSSGRTITIFQRANCHLYQFTDWHVSELKTVLEGFVGLARLGGAGLWH